MLNTNRPSRVHVPEYARTSVSARSSISARSCRNGQSSGKHWEKEAYEQRICDTFRREQIIENLHCMRLLSSHHIDRSQYHEKAAIHRHLEERIGTPRARRRMQEARDEAAIVWAKYDRSPRFRDFQLDALLEQHASPRGTPRESLQNSSLSVHTPSVFTQPPMLSPSYDFSLNGGSSAVSRVGSPLRQSRVGTPLNHTFSNVAAPSIAEMEQRVKLPSFNSLMNPRCDPNWFHTPGAILDNEALLSAVSSARARECGHVSLPDKIEVLSLTRLLPIISKVFALKFDADSKSYMAVRNRVITLDHSPSGEDLATPHPPVLEPLRKTLTNYMVHLYGPQAAGDKTKQIIKSCSEKHGHGASHSRVALFRQMAGLGDTGFKPGRLKAGHEMAIVQLLVWMGLASTSTDPKQIVTSLDSPLGQVDVILGHLTRVLLLPMDGRTFCRKMAAELANEEQRGPKANVVDADELVRRWSSAWGAWDDKEKLIREIRAGIEKSRQQRSQADRDNDGKLDFGEFCVFVRAQEGEMSDEALRERFNAVDRDGSGKVDMAEYLLWQDQHLRSQADRDNDGKLDFVEFCVFVRAQEDEMSDEVLRERFNAVDHDSSGKIDMAEYLLWQNQHIDSSSSA